MFPDSARREMGDTNLHVFRPDIENLAATGPAFLMRRAGGNIRLSAPPPPDLPTG